MPANNSKPQLISTRRGAAFAACYAAYLSIASLRSLYPHVHHAHSSSGWAFPFDSFYPHWLSVLLNISTYFLFTWTLVHLAIEARHEERVYLVILMARILISPVKSLVSMTNAAWITWAQFFGGVVMTVAALILYRDLTTEGDTASEGNAQD